MKIKIRMAEALHKESWKTHDERNLKLQNWIYYTASDCSFGMDFHVF